MASATLSQLAAEIERYATKYWRRENKVWQVSRTCQTWQDGYLVGAGVAVVAAAAGFALFLLFL